MEHILAPDWSTDTSSLSMVKWKRNKNGVSDTLMSFCHPKLFPTARFVLVRFVPLPCTAKSAKRPQTIMLTSAIRPTRNMPQCNGKLDAKLRCVRKDCGHTSTKAFNHHVFAISLGTKRKTAKQTTKRRFCITSVIVLRAHVNHNIRLHTSSVAKSIERWRAPQPACNDLRVENQLTTNDGKSRSRNIHEPQFFF